MIKPSPEIKAVLTRWVRAVERRDTPTAVNLLMDAPEIRYIGTDPNEWWSGEEFVDAYPAHIRSFPDGLVFEILDIEAFESGDVGWGAVRQQTTFQDGSSAEARLTFVLVLSEGMWRIIQGHLSLGVPNLDVIGVELTGGLLELLASVRNDGDATDLRGGLRDGTITLVFTDIVDSTSLNAAVGDAKWTEILEKHQGAVRSIVDRRGGTIVKTLGDGAMIAFASTREALRAAIDIQRHHADIEAVDGIRLRVGAHVGDVMLTDDDYLGSTVSKAARIASAAGGGEIMVSDAVRLLLGESPEFSFGEATTVELKGLDGIHGVVPVLWAE